jgi:hypothetical protein
LRAILHELGLAMGIFDVKLTDDGEPVFLEVNAQGQFLFVEGLCGIPLADIFADFLHDQAIGDLTARQVRTGPPANVVRCEAVPG